MAQKELKYKISVDGKEIQLTKQQLDGLLKTGQITREEFNNMAESFSSAGDAIKNTNQATQDYDKTLKETKTDAEDLTDAMDDQSTEAESLAAQIGKVEDQMGLMILAGKENTEEFKKLQAESRKLKDAQETMQITSQKSLDTFAAMPGPIGLIGKTFKDLSVTAKLAKTGLQSMGLGFNTLGKAIMSSGIGALVILFGVLATAVIKALGSFKPLQAAMDRFKVLFDVLGKVIEPIVDMIGNALVVALDKLAYGIALITGSLDEYNKALADDAAMKKQEANLKKQQQLLEVNGDKYSEVQKAKTQADIDRLERLKSLNEEEIEDAAVLAKRKKEINDRYHRDIAAADKAEADRLEDKNKENQEKVKAQADKIREINKDYDNRLRSIQQENALLAVEDEFERGKLLLQQQYDNQLTEINQLKVNEKRKEELRVQYAENLRLKLGDIDDKIEEKRKADAKTKEDEEKANLEKEYNDKVSALQKELALYDIQLKVLLEGSDEYWAQLRLIEDDAYAQKVLAAQGNAELLEALAEEHNANLKNIDLQKLIFDKQVAIEKMGILAGIGSSLQQLAGKNKALAIAGIIIEKASSIGQIVAQTGIANAKAVAANPVMFGQPWVAINTISAGLSIAASIKAGATAIKEINSAGAGGGGGEGGAPPQNLGKNYEKGGYIKGRRHAEGGVMLEAEGGEAIMTRGAVSRFGPMLSMMNQMGGGVGFSSDVSQSSYDNPKTADYSNSMESTIIKTYVVEQDLTTAQQRQSRLKDLSTL